MKKRILSLLIALVMAVGLLPTVAFAEVGADDVAKIGDNGYATLQDAINAATDGTETTITMIADVENISNAITIPQEKIIVLDMDSHKITVGASFSGRAIENKGTLTVQGNGRIDASNGSGGYGAINNTGTLTIENGTFRGNSKTNTGNIRNYGKDAVLVINDGTFDTSSTAVLNYDGLATLNGGTYTTHDHNCSTCGSNWSYVIRTYTDGVNGVYPRLYVNGGTYTGTQGALSSSAGYIEVNGGTFKTVPCAAGHTAVFYALYAAGEYGEVQCIINDGTFETVGTVAGRPAVLIGNDNTNGDGGINADALSHIYGGTFIAPEGIPAVGVSPNTAKASVIHGGTYTLLTENARKYVDPAKVAVDGSGNTVVEARTEDAEDAVAKVGDDVYASLQDALAAAQENDTITLLKDVEISNKIQINTSNLTIDGNGKAIGLTAAVDNGGAIDVLKDNVTISNVTINTNGKAKHGVQFYCCTGGKLENATVNGGRFTSVIVNGATDVTLKNCTLNPDESAYTNIEYAMGSGVETIPTMTLDNVTGTNDLMVWADNDTVGKMIEHDNDVTAENVTDTVVSNITSLNNNSFTIKVQVDANEDAASVTKPSTKPSNPDKPSIPGFIPGIIAGGAGSMMQHFVDVTSMDYYFDAVQWAVEHGITEGTGKVTFSPDAPCTRAQAVTFLWRAMGSRRADKAANFTDVKAGAYYADAVNWAVEEGITNGTSDTTFSPDAICTRSQIVTFLYRAIGVRSTVDAGFSDVAANAYYAEAINWAAQYGITGGTGANKFSPDAPCTRAQIVTFLYRAN